MFGQLSNIESLRETKIKVQHLVFPNGIFWNHETGVIELLRRVWYSI